jgi:ectoine hydroxylase-related dioxygenase (phytanoyl-CoA dioxygenase family)
MMRSTLDAGQVIAALERDGYAIVERYLDLSGVEAKKADLERILRTVPSGRDDFEGLATQRVYALFAKTRAFDALAIDPVVIAVVEHVLKPGFLLNAPHAIRIGPGETAQPLHHDDDVYPVPRPHDELVVNTMWALDDFTEANGATRLVPLGATDPVTATMPAGSVAFFLGSLHHGGGANTTDRPRLGVVLSYCAGWLRPQENHLLAVPREIVKQLPDCLQELLGYNLYGLLGGVDGRNPRKFVDDTRQVADGVVVI